MDESIVLETERLLLRKFTLGDVAALTAVIGDPIAMRWYPAPFDHDGATAWIKGNIQRYQRDGYGLWAMVLKASAELIGDCGCAIQEVGDKQEIEIGYHVRRDLWGNGYATEAARACMEFAFNKLGARRVISIIRPENVNSLRVAEKNGLTCEKIVIWRNYNSCIYVKERHDR